MDLGSELCRGNSESTALYIGRSAFTQVAHTDPNRKDAYDS